MAWPTLVLRIAFASAPMATSPSWDAVTSSLRSIHIKRGRQHELDQISAGTAQLELDNRAGNYWPNNAGGDYSPNVLPGKRIQLYAVYGGVTYYLYTGFIEDWNPEWLVANAGLFPIVRPVCSDLCNNLANFDLNDGAGHISSRILVSPAERGAPESPYLQQLPIHFGRSHMNFFSSKSMLKIVFPIRIIQVPCPSYLSGSVSP